MLWAIQISSIGMEYIARERENEEENDIEIERANISFSRVCVKAHLIWLSHQLKGVYFAHIQNDCVCE